MRTLEELDQFFCDVDLPGSLIEVALQHGLEARMGGSRLDIMPQRGRYTTKKVEGALLQYIENNPLEESEVMIDTGDFDCRIQLEQIAGYRLIERAPSGDELITDEERKAYDIGREFEKMKWGTKVRITFPEGYAFRRYIDHMDVRRLVVIDNPERKFLESRGGRLEAAVSFEAVFRGCREYNDSLVYCLSFSLPGGYELEIDSDEIESYEILQEKK